MLKNMKKIAFHILICIILPKHHSSAVHLLNCTKSNPKVLGFKYNCILPGNYDTNPEQVIAAFPVDIVLDTAEIVEIKPLVRFTFLLNDTNIFKKLQIVRILSFSNLYQFSPSEKFKTEPTERITYKLFDLPFLESLSIPNAKLNTNEHTWVFPEQLIFLNLSNNQYTKYNLENNIDLEVADFTNNLLAEVPTFYHPLRSLRELHLSGNPLNNVTVEDIAKLCALEILTLEKTSFEAEDPVRYCECRKLKRWLEFLEYWMKNEHYRGQYAETKFGGEINCNKNIDVVCRDIIGSKYTLKEAYKLREICLSGRTDPIEYKIHNEEDPFSMEKYDAKDKRSSTQDNDVKGSLL